MLALCRSALRCPPPALVRCNSSNAQENLAVVAKILTEFEDVISDAPAPVFAPKHAKWRTFQRSDIITPNQLKPQKCARERKFTKRPVVPPPAPVTRYNDIFHQLGLDPLDFSLNPTLLSSYTSEMGKVYGRNITGLSARSQRRLGKAIRRARMIGVLPQLSRPSTQWVPRPYKTYIR